VAPGDRRHLGAGALLGDGVVERAAAVPRRPKPPSNALGWAGTIKAQGVAFAATGEGKVAVVDPRDLAASAVAALTRPGHEGSGTS
jgi:uncharacterized protein YbjT (DUF2867 family)